MQANDFVSTNHIISEVVKIVDDEKFRKGFSKGWYTSQIQDALQGLSFDTFWQDLTLDYELPENLVLAMPDNMFNIREIYVYHGDGCCSPMNSEIVHWKRLFDNKGKEGYTARVKDRSSGSGTNSSPFVPDYFDWNHNGYERTVRYYANAKNGKIMFSSSCKNFTKVRIIGNGMGVPVGDIPSIPRFFEEAVKDWVIEKFYRAMQGRDPRTYRALYLEAKDKRENLRTGTWKEARIRISSMDTWMKEDLNEYISSMYHK
jgi:hypothetical protein